MTVFDSLERKVVIEIIVLKHLHVSSPHWVTFYCNDNNFNIHNNLVWLRVLETGCGLVAHIYCYIDSLQPGLLLLNTLTTFTLAILQLNQAQPSITKN